MPKLTEQQMEILRMLGVGVSTKAIAIKLGISEKTVEFHIAGTENPNSLYKALQCRSRAELIRFAIEHGLVKPGDKAEPDKASPEKAPPATVLKTTSDLGGALLRCASLAAEGKADVLQVNALCQCTDSLIELARLTMQVRDRYPAGAMKEMAPWLEEGK